MWRGARLGLIALLSVLLAPDRALGSELRWEGPPECAAGEQLRFAIERALGAPLARASRLDFEVRAELSGSLASARLRVVAPASEGDAEPTKRTALAKERVFVAPDCSKLVDTLAVAITLAIASAAPPASESAADDAGALPPPATAAPVPAPPSATVSPASTPALASDAPEPGAVGDGVRPGVLFALVGDSGSLPSPALGASLGVELALNPIAVRAFGTLLFEQRVQLSAPDGAAAADLSSTFGTLEACADALTATSALSVPLCAGADAGVLSGSGVSIARPERATAAWFAARADIGLLWEVPATRLRVEAMLTAAAPLVRDEFVVHGIGAVHRASPLVGRAALGLGLHF